MESLQVDPDYVTKIPLPCTPQTLIDLMIPHLRQIMLFADFRCKAKQIEKAVSYGTSISQGHILVGDFDGDGRTEAKALERSVSLTYATESMRLTTRLMQLASWLLLHRAVKEGEMTLTQANREKTKVKLSAADPGPVDMIERLPQHLQDLITRSMNLQARVRRLDTTIHAPAAERAPIGNPLVPQLNRLKAAFER